MIRDFFKYIINLIKYSQKHSQGIFSLMFKIIISIFKDGVSLKEVIRQMYVIGYKSIAFSVIIMGILGVILVNEFGSQAVKITGSASEVGGPYMQLIVRQFGPFITGMMFANKIGSSISSEISLMKLRQELDALKMNGINLINYLAAPKLIAGSIMIFVLSILASYSAWFSGMLSAKILFKVDFITFINYQFINGFDIMQGVLKSFLIGAFIPVIAVYCGLNADRNSSGVGRASTSAVVMGLSAVGVIDLIIGALIFIISF